MKLFKPLLFALAVCTSSSYAQNNAAPNWLSMQFSKKVSLQTAMIEIDNKPAVYSDLLKIPDSSLLKVEVYSKKAAQQLVDKDEAKNGLVLVTLHKKHFPYPTAKKDDDKYIIGENGDTIHCVKTQVAIIGGDTSGKTWNHFLEHNLNAQAPADNGAPAGLYNVDISFLVNEDGTVSEVTVLEDPGYGTGAEVKRLMGKSPNWSPAMCDQTVVVYRQRQRITFAVSEE